MGRRDLLRAVLSGLPLQLGTPTPSRFPYADRPQPGAGVGPGQGQTVRARFVVITTATGGVFVYSGTPAAGNPPILWMTGGGTDPYGNALPVPAGGIGTQSASGWVDLVNDAILFGATGQPVARAGSIAPNGNGELLLNSGISAAAGDAALQVFFESSANNASTVPLMHVLGAATIDDALTATGGTAAAPTLIETDGWHNMAPLLAAGFAAGVPVPQYRLMPDGTVLLRGQVSLTAAEAAGTTFATLAAPYLTTARGNYLTQNSLSGFGLTTSSVDVSTSGALQLGAAGILGNTFVLDGIRYPVI